MLNAQAPVRHVADLVWPAASRLHPLLRAIGLALVGTLLLTLSAKAQVPFYPVPMTLQTMVVFLIGITYGPRLGVATVALYLLQGALGYPVFAGTPEKGIGLAYMMGPTGGYLAGFLLAALITGIVAERLPRWPAVAAAIAVATLLVYLLGAAWLATFVGVEKVWALGIAPFLLGDFVKLLLATALAQVGLSALRRRIARDLSRDR
jgi:biotin transport system substrate-specific component